MNDKEIYFDAEFVRSRITELRLKMDPPPSERDMSLSLGQNHSYIHTMMNSKTGPRWDVFFHICEYLKVTPAQFFNVSDDDPAKNKWIVDQLKELFGDQFEVFVALLTSLDKEKIRIILQLFRDVTKKLNE